MTHAATESDIPRVIEILADSFYRDPTWSWAFPDPVNRRSQLAHWWELYVAGACRYENSVWISENGESASVWYPPGAREFSPEQEILVEPLFTELVGEEQAQKILALLEAFDVNHPLDQPHFYLSLLGTHTDQLGKGVGFALLADNLDYVDNHSLPAYLEASNPANVALYERYGFREVGQFSVDDSPTVHTMWRPAIAG